jgi:hypothetical protein
MLITLARKELRELLPLIILGALLEFYLVCTATGMRLGFFEQNSIGVIPFVSEETSQLFFYVSGGVGFALALWQTMLESTRGTFQFLLHRPLERTEIFGTKLVVGATACLFVAALPVLCYALWAAAPGTHASPFQWSMTVWAWQLCLQMPLVYFGAFLSGLRPGRWFGSRFLPLAASVAALSAFQSLSAWPWATFLACLAAEAAFVLVILNVGKSRDFS